MATMTFQIPIHTPTYAVCAETRLANCLLLVANAGSQCVALVTFMSEVKGTNVALNATFAINVTKVCSVSSFLATDGFRCKICCLIVY